jgi:hypothetical protein
MGITANKAHFNIPSPNDLIEQNCIKILKKILENPRLTKEIA